MLLRPSIDSVRMLFATVVLVSLLPPASSSAAGPVQPPLAHQQLSAKPFEDVVADAQFAIGEFNYRITGRNQIGAAIREHYGDPFPPSVVIHFCNLEHARQLLIKAPELAAHMPCKLVIYETAEGVAVSTWLLPPDPRLGELRGQVNDMLQQIVDYAVK
jgi:uncharacterized protein (DUF302 family)